MIQYKQNPLLQESMIQLLLAQDRWTYATATIFSKEGQKYWS
jgi:hypothetical protein